MDISITVTVKNVAPTDLEAVLAKIRELDDLVHPGGLSELLPLAALPSATSLPASNDLPAELTEGQARLLVEGCSGKTLTVLRTLLDGRDIPFNLASFMRETDIGLGWVWGGLTKRTRNILKNPNARLIVWHNHYDDLGKWVDADGDLAVATVEALRKALGITAP